MTRSARILIVDDRPENLLALEALLEPLGCPVQRATSGNEALKLLLHETYALILLDVQMPGMDGYETAEYIQTLDRTRRVPIIFLTALNKDEGHVFRGYRAGAVDYVIKPYDPHILLSKVTVFVDMYEQGVEMRESEARHKAALENAPMGVGIVDGDGRWVRLNRAFGAMLAISPEGLVGTEWPDAGLTSVADGETEIERSWPRAGGESCVLIVRTAPVGDGTQNMVVMAIDVTTRRRAEEASAREARKAAALAAELAAQKDLGALQRRLEQAQFPDLPEELPVRAFYRKGERRPLLGGDFYDALRLPDGALAVVIGDVSGESADAGAMAASLRIAWRALSLAGQELEGIVSGMHNVLRVERKDASMFATVCCTRFAPDGQSAIFVAVGHPPPILLGRTIRSEVFPTGPPLGALDEWDWRASSFMLGKSESVMLYTDGLVEGRGETGSSEREGVSRLLDALAQRDMAAEGAVRELVDEIAARGGRMPDDVAVLIVAPQARHAARPARTRAAAAG